MSNQDFEFVRSMRERQAVKTCPCGEHNNKDGKFVPFVGHTKYGHCHSCGLTFYHEKQKKMNMYSHHKPDYYIPLEIIERTLTFYNQNNFTLWLEHVIGQEGLLNALNNYSIGTAKHWKGATIFWTIDKDFIPRRGSIMIYNSEGHREKNKNHSVHALLGKSEHKPAECFFGEHLLTGTISPVAIVESAKTAIIANHFMPNYIWLSCNGASGLTRQKTEVLKNRLVYLFPDEGKYESWKNLADSFKDITEVRVSRIVEENSIKGSGDDLADLLLIMQNHPTNLGY